MKRIAIILLLFISLDCMASNAAVMSVEQILQKVVDHYPSLRTAAIQVERARQTTNKVNSQLGWQLGAQAGISHDTGLFGIPTDSVDIGGSISRQLESGSSISVEASARRDDSENAFSPAIPNPATTTSIDLTFRQPLAKGADNPSFKEGLASAKAELTASQAKSKTLHDQIATQVVDLAITAATIKTRIDNKQRALKRTRRLQAFIKDRAELGISEEKDILQVNAQSDAINAELKSLETAWQTQLISLNRLMGRNWSSGLKLQLEDNENSLVFRHDEVLNLAKQHSPELKNVDARIALADSAIRQRRDEREDNLDLVVYVGNRTEDGDTVTGSTSSSEVVGGVRLEFQQSVDKSGVDAELYQAQLDRSAALQDKRQLIEDLEYEISQLLAEIQANKAAIKAYKRSVSSEKKKLDDATERYQTGRTDTDQLIQFEDQLSQAEFALELQRLELTKRHYRVKLVQGTLWETISIPEYRDFDAQGITE